MTAKKKFLTWQVVMVASFFVAYRGVLFFKADSGYWIACLFASLIMFYISGAMKSHKEDLAEGHTISTDTIKVTLLFFLIRFFVPLVGLIIAAVFAAYSVWFTPPVHYLCNGVDTTEWVQENHCVFLHS